MRMIEIFTSYEFIRQRSSATVNEQETMQLIKSIFSLMIDESYFKNMRIMMADKINENTYDEELTIRPRTEISKVIFEMIWRPLKLLNELVIDQDFDNKILASFIQEILIYDPNFTIVNFIIPSLASSSSFPFAKLLNFLYTHKEQNYFKKPPYILSENKIILCHLILQLDVNFLDELIKQQNLHQYLVVLGQMIGCISKLPKPKESEKFSYVDENESNSEDDESEDENGDQEMESQFERFVLLNIIKQLNDENRVNKIVNNLNTVLHLPEAIQSICNIAHNLYLYNRTIHDSQLLDLLAFKPEFLRTLWYTLLTMKSEKNQLLITILSKGITISKLIIILRHNALNIKFIIAPSESLKIIPILATFCALFSRLISTLHDGEFLYCIFDNDEQSIITMESASSVEKIENRIMPFHIKDVSHMCVTLKELCKFNTKN
jgi:ubiquitin-protein ligase E3 C